jgi:hypothetical protein
MFLTTENIGQFKNRLLMLLEKNLSFKKNIKISDHCKGFSRTDLKEILQDAQVKIIENRYISLYPPFRMEPLNVNRYIYKYFNYFAMKCMPPLRKDFFVEAKNLSKKDKLF